MKYIRSSTLKVGDIVNQTTKIKGELILKKFQIVKEVDEKKEETDVLSSLIAPLDKKFLEDAPKSRKSKRTPAKKFEALEVNHFTKVNKDSYGVMIFSLTKPIENSFYSIYVKDSDNPQQIKIVKVLVDRPNKNFGWICSIENNQKTS